MKQSQIMLKFFTAAILFTAHMALAQTEVSKEEIKKNDGLWAKTLDNVRSTKLSQKINIPSVELYRGIELGANYRFNSNPSIAQNYSGIDIWEIKATVDSKIFNYDLPVGIGASASKKITYIQQFKTRRESLLRAPYDPITKIPRKSADFFKKDDKNQFVFKTGDFIGYRLPLTFQIGVNEAQTLAGSLIPINIGFNYFISGEFDIQIFRMTENHIRLKLIAVNDKTKSIFGNVRIFVQDPITSKIIDKLLDDTIYSGTTATRKTDLYLGDYILNITSQDARNLFDSILGEKMQIINGNLMRKYLKTTDFLREREQFNQNLFADLSKFNALAALDTNLPFEQRRAIKIINAENHTDAEEAFSTFNLLRLLKLTRNKNTTDANIAVVGDSADDKENYFLHSVGKNSQLNILSNWGKDKRSQLNILFKADHQKNKNGLIGLHLAKSREDYKLPGYKYLDFYEKSTQHMPDIIKNVIKFPHNEENFKKNYHNLFLNFELYVTSKVFELNQNIPKQIVQERIDKFVNGLKNHKYKINNPDKDEVVDTLTKFFSTQVNFDEKFKIFNQLMLQNDLFANYGSAIMMNVIHESSIPKCILIQFSYSSYETGSAVLKYPSEESFNSLNLFRNIIEQNNYILDRSYNLRNYLKEDGKPFSVEELILKNVAKNQ